MHKATVVVDFAYVSPRGGGKKSGSSHLRAKLKYLQYRDDRNRHIKQEPGQERWQDHGLGTHYRAILNHCSELQSKHVLAWSWVVSPAPDLMAMVPEDLRRDLVIDLTERVVESYYAARGADVPEYVLVLHDRLTTQADGQAGLSQLHTHVILPGTVPTMGGREPFYNNANKGHDRLFREIASQHFETALDTLVGPEWRRLRPDPEPSALDPDDISAWFGPKLEL